MATTPTPKTTLNVYLPNGDSKLVKYVGGTNVATITDLVVAKFLQRVKPYSRCYALYLRHTDSTKVRPASGICLGFSIRREE